MKTTREDILNKLNLLVGDNSNDEVLGLIEDITDTIQPIDTTEVEGLRAEVEALKSKVVDTENEWRAKYKARFFEPVGECPPVVAEEPTAEDIAEAIAIEDLFED